MARDFGGSSISILLDQDKCYEMVPFSCLWQEALFSDFSPTLCWMVLRSYGQRRVIKGLGSYSHQVQTKQGIWAGCPLATTLLRVLYLRTLARLAQQHSSVSFGVLVDDWSIHWRTSNPYGRGLRKVVDALEDTLKSLTMLGSLPSSSKSGAVCSKFLRPFKMKVKRHMRDQSGPYARRESWCGQEGCAHDPEDGCGSVTRFEQVAQSFDGTCVGTQCQVRSIVCCYSPTGAGICDSDLGCPHQPRIAGSCAQGLVAMSQFETVVAWSSWNVGCGDHEFAKDGLVP